MAYARRKFVMFNNLKARQLPRRRYCALPNYTVLKKKREAVLPQNGLPFVRKRPNRSSMIWKPGYMRNYCKSPSSLLNISNPCCPWLALASIDRPFRILFSSLSRSALVLGIGLRLAGSGNLVLCFIAPHQGCSARLKIRRAAPATGRRR